MPASTAPPAVWWTTAEGRREAHRLGLSESARVALSFGVIYQIYPRSFQDSNGDGIGDLAGITRRLDYVANTLGVDSIWISPFYPSPMDDFGYDVADYCDVDPRFGTLEDLDRLVAEAHARSLRVIIDWVPNHSSDRHPWFVESRSSRHNPKRHWYVWRDSAPDGGPPNNWQSVFGGGAWEWDETTGQYYLHSFLESQPDLNWRNPEVEEAMFDTVRFWMDRGVDGLRIDVAHYVMKDPEFRDNPLAPPHELVFKDLGDYERFDHIHDKGHPDVHDVFRRLRTLLDSYEGDRFAVGEIHIFDWDQWATYYGGAALDELHMPYNFSLLFAPWRADEFRRRIDAMEAALPTGACPNHVFGNHDEVRIATRYGVEHTRLAAMLLLTLRGTPTMYYGDEIGMPQVDIELEHQQDPWGIRVPGQGRDGCRTPMQWTADPGAGFTDGTPWLPLTPAAAHLNVEALLAEPDSLLHLYRQLLRVRRHHRALQIGAYHPLDAVPADVFGFERVSGAERLVVVLNFGDHPVEATLPGDGEIVVSTGLDRAGEVSGRVALDGHEGLVIELS
jgi:glycosidase